MDDPGIPFYKDLSLWVLLFFNTVTIFYAVEKNWSLGTIMVVYLVQNVIIGVFSFIKIYTVKHFTIPKGMQILGKPMTHLRKDVHRSAFTFAFAYYFFHVLYSLVVFLEFEGVNIQYVLLGGSIFFVDHLFSFIYNRKKYEKEVRNIGTMWIAPFARILPMHLVLVIYGVILSGRGPLLLFLGLKTFADIVMHVVEHR